jgi:hypothetical protein
LRGIEPTLGGTWLVRENGKREGEDLGKFGMENVLGFLKHLQFISLNNVLKYFYL